MIELQNIEVKFNLNTPLEKHVIKDVGLKIHENEFVTLIGPNGSGKSTLLRVFSGDLKPTSGHVLIDNVETTNFPDYDCARNTAQVFQDPRLGTCASLSIVENLALAYKRGYPRKFNFAISSKRRKEFAERLEVLGVGLENRLDDIVGMLSGGQRQALSLIMTTLAPSKVLLLDEHTAALDPRMSQFVLELTNKVYEEFKLTVVMVTHSMNQAISYGNRTIMMLDGKIRLDLSGEARTNASSQTLRDEFNKEV